MMRLTIIVIILLLSFLMLSSEEADTLKNNVPETSNSVNLEAEDSASEDVFVDENGDGIADNRTFRERMRNWRQTRTMSERILVPGTGNSENPGKFGNKSKKGGQEGNGGSTHGNGNGNGNG